MLCLPFIKIYIKFFKWYSRSLQNIKLFDLHLFFFRLLLILFDHFRFLLHHDILAFIHLRFLFDQSRKVHFNFTWILFLSSFLFFRRFWLNFFFLFGFWLWALRCDFEGGYTLRVLNDFVAVVAAEAVVSHLDCAFCYEIRN